MAESVTMSDHFDLFSMEADAFESDVHVLIREALNAALEHLSPKADADQASLEDFMKTVTDDDYHEHLVDEHVGVMSQYGDQERFLRNIALVALASPRAAALPRNARSIVVAGGYLDSLALIRPITLGEARNVVPSRRRNASDKFTNP
jgi:hypothetical protein